MKMYFANRDFDQLEKSRAKKILSSYWYCKNRRLKDIRSRHFKGVELDFFIDSGAFSAFTKGHEIRVEDYSDWIESNKEYLSLYANLDVIGNQVLTRLNQEIMEGRGLFPLPVFHVGSGLKELRRLCEKYEYIAIGGMVPYMKRVNTIWPSLVKIFEIGVDNRLHGFGCTNQKVLFNLPWYSVDSTTWLSGARYGEVTLFDPRSVSIISISLGDWDSWRKYRYIVGDLGFDWRKVASNRTLDKPILFSLCRASFEQLEEYLTERWKNE